MMPASLIMEGMAQTAGILAGEARGFKEKVILAKIGKAEFHHPAVPGDRLEFHAELERIDESGAATSGQVFRDTGSSRDLLAEIDIVFSHIDQNMGQRQFPKENFVFTDQFKQLLGTYRVEIE
jgi:3-hydroxyacyl-[acyl-carrier-protein] dehydratase